MAILFWIKRPWLIPARVKYWVWEKRNRDKPWLCPGTVAFCEAKLSKSMKALEFGSGRSTHWLARLVGHVTSVEHDATWYSEVQQQLALAQATNVDYLNIPLDHPLSAPEQPSYQPIPKYVAVADCFADQSLDLIIVDGHYRKTCIRHATRKLAPRGYLLLDDANRWPSLAALGVPPHFRIVDDSTNGIKRCVIWQAD
jgi:predicted O-methyltransferase YrrM